MKELTPLQQKLLEELKWFDAFCTEHRLKYYAIGGTLLGAMRHKGFIPWDDDIDLGMPRKDFEQLHDYMNAKGRYAIETYRSEQKDFCYSYAKVYDTTTTLIEHKRKDIVRGVFLDIFPLDGIGDTKEESERNFVKIERLYQYYLTMVAGIRKGRSAIKNLAVILSRLVPAFVQNPKGVSAKLNKLCASRDFDNSRYVGNLMGAYGRREIVERNVFGEPNRREFEDMELCCPQFAADYLAHIYHDWEKLPPPEKQVSHHDFAFLDLQMPYTLIQDSGIQIKVKEQA